MTEEQSTMATGAAIPTTDVYALLRKTADEMTPEQRAALVPGYSALARDYSQEGGWSARVREDGSPDGGGALAAFLAAAVHLGTTYGTAVPVPPREDHQDDAGLTPDRVAAMVEEARAEERRNAAARMDSFKERVRDAASNLRAERGWCLPGTNEVLRDLGVRELVDCYAVEVEVTYTRTITVHVSGESSESDAEYEVNGWSEYNAAYAFEDETGVSARDVNNGEWSLSWSAQSATECDDEG